MSSACVVCGHTVLPEVSAAFALALWTLEAAAQGAVAALLLILWARLLRWRLPFWPTLVTVVAFAVGRVWA